MLSRLLTVLMISLSALTLSSCFPTKPLAKQKVLRISVEDEPHTLDPRQARDLATATAIHLVYEGLFRAQGGSIPEPALAASYTVSPDQKTYTFKLRPSGWSNGQPVTAHDFEATWKSVLNPTYAAPNAYQLYVIKNGQKAKEGKVPLDQVGVKATDASTLVVELENPTPYFLELLSTYFFYPASPTLLAYQGKEPLDPSRIPTNGPYQLASWKQNEFIVTPHPHYWDRQAVKIDQIAFSHVDNLTAYQLFRKDEVDWTGSPLGTLPTDALQNLKQSGDLKTKSSAGVHLLRLNVEKAPFDNSKVRRAFAYALNRTELVEHVLQGNQIPATGIVPSQTASKSSFFQDGNLNQARAMFKQYLLDNKLTVQTLPPITLLYGNNERSHKIAQVAQQQWKEAFGIEPQLQSVESKVFFSQIKNHDYQISIGSWYADYNDPISYLEIFKYKDNGTNNTQWQNSAYIYLLDQSTQAKNPHQRNSLLLAAEKVLMDEMPVIPLFFNTYNYLQKPTVKGVYFSELGYLDFKHASVSE